MAEVAGLLRSGHSQTTIARLVGVSRATVQRDLQRLRATWRRSNPEAVDAARCLAEGKLRWICKEAEAAWEDSKSSEGGPDPRFLETIRRGLADYRALLGLDSPVPQEVDVRGEVRTMTVFGLLQLAEEAAKPENLPTIISADGQVMVRGPDGVPRLPEAGTGEGEPLAG
jgi:hypothetical protein